MDSGVAGTHVRVLTFPYAPGYAIQVARPLTEVDHTLDRIRLFLIIIAAGGIAIAAALGLLVSRAALALLSRQSKLIEQQAKLLNKYSEVRVWQFHYVFVKATYDFAFGIDEGKFDKLKSEYEKAIWLALLDFRRTISGAIYLVPEGHFRHLLDLFDELVQRRQIWH